MSIDWLTKDLWRAHVSWLTPNWVGSTEEGRRAFDAVRWIDQLQSAHYQTLIFYIKHHDGFCTYPSKFSNIQPERDFFGECVEETRKRGMRILAYYSSNLDQLSGAEHPEWQTMDRDGNPAKGWYDNLWPGSYMCINNPDYRNLLFGQLAELRDNYQPAGFWMDVFGPHTGDTCFCKHCQEKYHNETGCDLLTSNARFKWYGSCYSDLMREIRETVKTNNPDCVLCHNTGPRILAVDSYCDFLTHEAVNSVDISLMCRSFASENKPFESTYRLFSAVGSWSLRGPDRVLLDSMTTIAHGGACSIEVSPIHQGVITDGTIRCISEVGKYIRDREQYLIDAKPIYDVAIFEPETAYGWTRPDGWQNVLLERQIPFGILYADSDLSGYRLLILDGSISLDEQLARRITEYIETGGSLIVECDAAQFGTPVGDILSDVLGIRDMGSTGCPAQYISISDERLAGEMGLDDLIIEGEAHKIKVTTAETLAYYRYEFADRSPDKNILINLPPSKTRSNDPAVTVNQYGKGRAMYVGCPITTNEIRNHRKKWEDTREYPIQLAVNLARYMISDPLIKGCIPPGVEIAVNSLGKRYIVHVLNHYSCGWYYDTRPGVLKLADIRVCINQERIGQVSKAMQITSDGNIELPVRCEGEWVEIVVLKVGVHEMVVLEVEG